MGITAGDVDMYDEDAIWIENSSDKIDIGDLLMEVIWMILLYPSVHDYTPKQKEEITEHIYKKFWLKKKPLIQHQDHLILYK